jgi:hypothetical protein
LVVGIVASHHHAVVSGYYVLQSTILRQLSLCGLAISSIWLIAEQRRIRQSSAFPLICEQMTFTENSCDFQSRQRKEGAGCGAPGSAGAIEIWLALIRAATLHRRDLQDMKSGWITIAFEIGGSGSIMKALP